MEIESFNKSKGVLKRFYARTMVAYFCHHMSDNYVALSDVYVDLSVIYVDLSDHCVDLSE